MKLAKFQLKQNDRTKKDEILINKRSRLMDPDDDEVNFDFIRPADSERQNDVLMTVDDVKNSEFDNAKVVNTFGRITFTGSTETVTTKGKLLQKQKALLTDNTGLVGGRHQPS